MDYFTCHCHEVELTQQSPKAHSLYLPVCKGARDVAHTMAPHISLVQAVREDLHLFSLLWLHV